MNKHDWANLQFLLNADAETMRCWYATVSEDDINYALEILNAYRNELTVRELELMDDVEDLTDAEVVITRVMSRK